MSPSSKKKTRDYVTERMVGIPSELTQTEADLLSKLQNGYQIETSSLESGPILRRLKDNKVLRTESANRTTIKALADRGLISESKSADPLITVWRISKPSTKRKKRE